MIRIARMYTVLALGVPRRVVKPPGGEESGIMAEIGRCVPCDMSHMATAPNSACCELRPASAALLLRFPALPITACENRSLSYRLLSGSSSTLTHPPLSHVPTCPSPVIQMPRRSRSRSWQCAPSLG